MLDILVDENYYPVQKMHMVGRQGDQQSFELCEDQDIQILALTLAGLSRPDPQLLQKAQEKQSRYSGWQERKKWFIIPAFLA